MRKALPLFIAASLMAFAGSALAEKKAKSDILHCGCAYDGALDAASMVYKALNISHKSRGHDAHEATSVDSCYTGTKLVFDEDLQQEVEVDTYADFVRTGSDCQLGGPPLGDPIGSCLDEETDEPLVVEGDVCGEEIVLP